MLSKRAVDIPELSQSSRAGRLFAPDFVRGIAVGLLVLTNVPLIFTSIRYHQAAGKPAFEGNALDDIAIFIFLSIPAMAGMGMFVLVMSVGLSGAFASKGGKRAATTRLLGLGALGILHGLFVWWGDILAYYAVAGIISIQFQGRSPRYLIAAGASLTTFPIVFTVVDACAQLGGLSQMIVESLKDATENYVGGAIPAELAYQSGQWSMVQVQRFADWFGYFQDFAFIGIMQLVGLFMVGLGIARLNLFSDPEKGNAFWVIVLKYIAPAAIVLYVFQLLHQSLFTQDRGTIASLSSAAHLIAAPAIALCACALSVKYSGRIKRTWFGRGAAGAGRYSLTIYLGCSISSAVFAYGFRLYSEIPMWVLTSICIAILAAFYVVCPYLVERHVVGPFERLN